MAFRSLGPGNSPLGQYINQGLSRLQQTQSQGRAQDFQGEQSLLGRQHQTTMQEDQQQYLTDAATTLFDRQAPERARAAELHGLQTEQFRGVRDSNFLNDLIQQSMGGYGESLYDPAKSNIGMQDGAMFIPQQVKDMAGMSQMDIAEGLSQYMLGQNLGLNETQQRELSGKVRALMAGGQGGLFRKDVFGKMSKDILQDISGLDEAFEPDELSDLFEKGMPQYMVDDFINPFSPDNQLIKNLSFPGKKEDESEMETGLGKFAEKLQGTPSNLREQAYALQQKYMADIERLREGRK